MTGVGGRPERTRAREAALQLLYRADVGRLEGADRESAMASYWEEADEYLEGDAALDVRTFAEELVAGVVMRQPEIDALISGSLQNWRIERVALIDRLVLRLAALELLLGADPPAVVLDEAIELARRFGGDDSARFVNGVADGMRKKMQR